MPRPDIITEYPLVTPANTLAGDRLELNGNLLRIYRGQVLVAERVLVQPGNNVTPGINPTDRSLTSVYYVRRDPMSSGVTANMVGVTVNQETGAREYAFSDGSTLEFTSYAHALNSVLTNTSECDMNASFARSMAILMALRRETSGAQPNCMVGRPVCVDCAAQLPVTVGVSLEVVP